jgi:small conductance mechanosensitive channel
MACARIGSAKSNEEMTMTWLDLPVLPTMLRLLVVVFLTVLVEWGLQVGRQQFMRSVERIVKNAEQAERVSTILEVAHGTLLVLVLVVAGLTILQVLGINVGPFLAGVGIVGLVISLSAQTLVKDFIGGLLIVVENQFAIGDYIQVANVEGRVERITLRSTCLRDWDGRYHVVPNGEVRVVSNATMDWAKATIELNVSADADMDVVLRTLDKAARKARVDDDVRADLIGPPQVAGWTGFKDGAVQVQLTAKTRPGRQWDVQAALRRYAVETLQAEGVPVSLP